MNYPLLPQERLPQSESQDRLRRCREQLRLLPQKVAGLLVFSPLNIYYFSGTLGSGLLWIPIEGQEVLLIRRGLERALSESSLQSIVPFRSYGDISALCKDAGSPLPQDKGSAVAVEMTGLSWSQAELFTSRIGDLQYIAGDSALKMTRMLKSAWEINKMRQAGKLHEYCLCQELPKRIHTGMSEWEIATIVHSLLLEQGHCGFVRTTSPNYAELEAICIGETGLYPNSQDRPLGVRGMHPATPTLGDRATVWNKDQLLVVDALFSWEGYCTDKTQCYWGGNTQPPDSVLRAQACCKTIQQEAAAMLKPDTLPSQIWTMAQEMAAQNGYEDNFMGAGRDRARFLGHGIGLEMDEFPALAARFDMPLVAGMTLAIEPKIALAGIGMVGVEETFLVTPSGGESLTGDGAGIISVA